VKRFQIHFLILFLLIYKPTIGQLTATDSLRTIISQSKNDSSRINAINNLSYSYIYSQRDSCIYYANLALSLSQKLNYEEGIIMSRENIGFRSIIDGDFSKALSILLNTLQLSENIRYIKGKELALIGLGTIYSFQSDHKKSIEYNLRGIEQAKLLNDDYWVRTSLTNISMDYEKLKNLDSALYYANLVYEKSLLSNDVVGLPRSLSILADLNEKKSNHNTALAYLRQALTFLHKSPNDYLISGIYYQMSDIFHQQNKSDSELHYAMQSFGVSKKINFIAGELSATDLLIHYFKTNENKDSILKYLELNISFKDSVFGQQKSKDFQTLSINENIRQKQIQEAKDQAQQEYKIKFEIYSLVGGLAIVLIVVFFLFRNNKQQKESTLKIERAFNDLKSTQQQLIQSEKMASLGELTAGIAHEIQNPLNFVNNFSEVSNELIEEMVDEVKKGNTTEVEAIANDIKQNLEKINHHGKRADAIIKGMLQHSRSSSGIKEPTDINALCDEYLRLSYHGLRAKDKSFNATIKTDLDNNIGNINIIPQDIGRVILNLLTNAFYVVDEKKKSGIENYEPTVSVSTKKVADQSDSYRIEIKVTDNGNGIPQKVLDKIFQPFFTTKPTGQGTGLGLSLSYDIVTKGHGGELIVETKEGKGSTFIIQLPAN
jgi:signal transduction histidine kinase